MTSAPPLPLVLRHHPPLFTEIWFVNTYLTWARILSIYEETLFWGIFFPADSIQLDIVRDSENK